MTVIDRLIETDVLPDPVLRLGIRWLVRERSRMEAEGGAEAQQARLMDWVRALRQSPIAKETEAANGSWEVSEPGSYRLVVDPEARTYRLESAEPGSIHDSGAADDAENRADAGRP